MLSVFSGIPMAHTRQPIDWKRDLLPPLSKRYQNSSFPQNTLKIYKYCYYVCDCFHEITRLFLLILSSSIKLTKWLIHQQNILICTMNVIGQICVFFPPHIINLICVIIWFNKIVKCRGSANIILCSTWCLKISSCLHFESAKKNDSLLWNGIFSRTSLSQ